MNYFIMLIINNLWYYFIRLLLHKFYCTFIFLSLSTCCRVRFISSNKINVWKRRYAEIVCVCMRGDLFTFASRRLFLQREQVILWGLSRFERVPAHRLAAPSRRGRLIWKIQDFTRGMPHFSGEHFARDSKCCARCEGCKIIIATRCVKSSPCTR